MFVPPVKLTFRSLQAVLISRFLINLRRADESQRTMQLGSFRLPTIASILGDLGEPLEQSRDEDEQDDRTAQRMAVTDDRDANEQQIIECICIGESDWGDIQVVSMTSIVLICRMAHIRVCRYLDMD